MIIPIIGATIATAIAEALIIALHTAIPSMGLLAITSEKYDEKINVTITVGNAELAQS